MFYQEKVNTTLQIKNYNKIKFVKVCYAIYIGDVCMLFISRWKASIVVLCLYISFPAEQMGNPNWNDSTWDLQIVVFLQAWTNLKKIFLIIIYCNQVHGLV